MKLRIVLLIVAVFSPLAGLLVSLRMLWAVFTNVERARLIALGWDDLGNVTTNGDARQFITRRAALARRDGKRWGCLLCKVLDVIDPAHCDKSLAKIKPD